MKRQALICLHGIGEQRSGYSLKSAAKLQDTFEKMLRKKDASITPPDLIFREVVWAPITSEPQAELWRRVNKKHDLDMVKLRKFLISFAGDAVAYQKTGDGDEVYNAIDAKVQSTVNAIVDEYPGEEIEYTFVAHSLGTIIASNYLYDHRNEITATNLFTLGSPLAVWALRYGDPAKANSPAQVEHPNGAWINILDDEDIIGYPLRELNPQYKDAVDMDYVTEIGGVISMGNPISHIGYWEDSNAIKPIAYKLMLDYLRIHQDRPYSKPAYLKYIRSLWNV
jgi:pimeloyl-ACP methyl ester carboxylesterase